MRIGTMAAGLICLAIVGLPASAQDQGKQLVGTWIPESVTVEDAGKKMQPFGPSPKGLFIFDGRRFSITIMRHDLPKMASNNRSTGTVEENQSIVRGSLAYFGTYTVSEADKSFVTHVEGSTFPNWSATDQKRMFQVSGNALTITNPAGSVGGVATVRLKRAQ
jgi:hypothetical protein